MICFTGMAESVYIWRFCGKGTYMDWREWLKQLTGSDEEDETEIWHAVFVRTGNEETVREKIAYTFRDTGIIPFVPKRCIRERKNGIWYKRIRTLFPGYILLRGRVEIEDYYRLKTVPGIVRILKGVNGLYRIKPEEIRIINRLMINGELIGTSTVLQQGDSIRITDGPLLGMEGIIQSIDSRKGRARVNISFLGDIRTVDLDIRIIKAENES